MVTRPDPHTFQQVTFPELVWLLESFHFERRISSIHIHHSNRPSHSQFQGVETILQMIQHHIEGHGLSTVAQHLTIDPNGSIWLGRNWNLPPASINGHNGNHMGGPLMIMLIGNFDRGKDRFDSREKTGQTAQRKTTLEVVSLLQEYLKLRPDSVYFASELSKYASSGNGITYGQFKQDLRHARKELKNKRRSTGKLPMPPESNSQLFQRFSSFFSTPPSQSDDLSAELQSNGLNSSRNFNYYINTNEGNTNQRGFLNRKVTREMIAELKPYVINLTEGFFSEDGHMKTSEADVNAIFDEHLVRAIEDLPKAETLHLLFYAHGGLVNEETALLEAYRHREWWQRNHVYPIYFVWETGFLQTLRRVITGGSASRDGSRGTTSDLGVEALARTLGGRQVWHAIKSSAYTATVDPKGGAHYTIEKLKAFLKLHGNRVKLHAVGHSAGAIFHSHFVPEVIKMTGENFNNVQFLAPALSLADFKERMMPKMGKSKGIEKLTIFTMKEHLERNDSTASPLYNRSILYLVSRAVEAKKMTPILGLEESIRDDNELMQVFGIGPQSAGDGEIIWSKSVASEGRSATHATRHVDFNCDRATMTSVLRRIKGLDDNDPLHEYPEENLCSTDRSLEQNIDITPELERLIEDGLLDPIMLINPNSHPSLIMNNTHPLGLGSQVNLNGPAGPLAGGQRRALCIGINQYSSKPLYGCVPDAKLWAETLQKWGFSQPRLLLDQAATRAAILDSINHLIDTSKSGDVVVIQFAGHGIQLPDTNGDEANQDSALDEALCPYDFEQGAYIIDDDIAQIFARIPVGVNVTCFFDCCHSGTNTRFAFGAGITSSVREGERARFLSATESRIERHRHFRAQMGGSRSGNQHGSAHMKQVVFSACRSTEVALEHNNQGDFTRYAIQQLNRSTNTLSNKQFYEMVVDAFGPEPSQNPELDCRPMAKNQLLLAPIMETTGNRTDSFSTGPSSPQYSVQTPTSNYDSVLLTNGTSNGY